MENSREEGFTLIEMLITLAIFSFLLVALLKIFVVGCWGTEKLMRSLELQQNARIAMDLLCHELRNGSAIQVEKSMLSFIEPVDQHQVSFYCDDKKQLIKRKNGGSNPVACFIEEIWFEQNGSLLAIKLIAVDGTSRLTLQHKIYLKKSLL